MVFIRNILKTALAYLCLLSTVFAQSPQQNLDKYWYYRYRLKNDFVKMGSGQGESIPAANREVDKDENPTRVLWGDATMALGWYIGVLATELYILEGNNQNIDKVREELYYALLALERLDENAEPEFDDNNGNPGAPDLNGFFIRDDVPLDFLSKTINNDNYKHFNQNLTSSVEAIQAESDFSNSVSGIKEMSQDQVSHLFVGLSLVSKFVPSYITSNGRSLYDMAVDNADRIIKHVRKDSWIIKNPVTGIKVHRGHNSVLWSYAFAKAAKKITGDGYQNVISLALFVPWQIQQHFQNPVRFNNPIMANLAGIGNSWAVPPYVLNSTRSGIEKVTYQPKAFTTYTTPEIIIPATSLTPADTIKSKSFTLIDEQWDWRGFYLLFHSVYHDKDKDMHPNVQIDLNSAPCEGPYFFNDTDKAFGGWASVMKYEKDFEDIYFGNPIHRGEYNGLDYMLLYNLRFIEEPTGLPFYQDKLEGIQDVNYPWITQFFSIGTKQNPLGVQAFKSIAAINVINSTANVTYRAGQEVSLLPGFHAVPGSDFYAIIQPFTCVNGSYQKTSMDSSEITLDSPYGMSASLPLENTFMSGNNDFTDGISEFDESEHGDPELQDEQAIAIFPNPSGGIYTITMSREIESTVQVINLLGDLVTMMHPKGSAFQIDISDQPEGIYFVKFVQDGHSFTRKLVKQ